MGWRTEPTAEMPVIRIDLSEAYAAMRQRGSTLRRRRLVSSGLAATILAGLFTVVGFYDISSVPLPDAMSLPATTTVYYADGTTVLARLGAQNRVNVAMADLPPHLPAAVVAAEDPEFWDDSGARISRLYARAATGLTGTSYSDRARSLVLGWKLEDTYSKQQILGFYLNTVYFGRGAYGIGSAAQAYFDKPATELSLAESVVLAGVLGSPGDARFDPSVSATRGRERFTAVLNQMVADAVVDQATADATRVPRVEAYDRLSFQSGLDRPTGLVVSHVLAELRETEAFRGRPADFIANGGLRIVTTIDARAQGLIEETADETVTGSVMNGQPGNLQAAAVVVQPGTGAVVAYYGGHDGTGADFAGWYRNAEDVAVGYGAHPPGQTFQIYTLAAALKAGVSVKSRWHSPPSRIFAEGGHTSANPVRDVVAARCQPACTLAEAMTASLNVPFFAAAQKVGIAGVLDVAREVGVDAMWVPETKTTPRQRIDLVDRGGGEAAPFGPDTALGLDPITVLDQANAMATFAAGGVRARAHFVQQVDDSSGVIYTASATGQRVLDKRLADDITWVLSQNKAGRLARRPAAAKEGVWQLRSSAVETAHAWMLGYTHNLAIAVWVGNREIELPLRDREGARITGTGLPAGIYRAFMGAAHDRLGLPVVAFSKPAYLGNPGAGDLR
jgi:membrane peptidoglycan carboxypeptidase